MTFLASLKENIEPLRQQLIGHSLYREIDSLEALQVFMRHHVYPVWDFMSLLKSLQQRLTCTGVPWIPATDSESSRLVNEIVLGEETDSDGEGGYASHFELYCRSMRQVGADTTAVDRMIADLRSGQAVSEALAHTDIPEPARKFSMATFKLIASGDLVEIAAAFAFGREDLLPDVFRQIIAQIDRAAESNLQPFLYYLDRHIELDEDRHGPMSDRLIESLCGDDDEKWHRAERAATDSLIQRILLWDAIELAIVGQRAGAVNFR